MSLTLAPIGVIFEPYVSAVGKTGLVKFRSNTKFVFFGIVYIYGAFNKFCLCDNGILKEFTALGIDDTAIITIPLPPLPPNVPQPCDDPPPPPPVLAPPAPPG